MKFKNTLYFSLFTIFFLPFLAACGSKISPKSSLSKEVQSQIIQKTENYLKTNQKYLQAAKGYAKVKLKIKSKKENFDAVVIVDLNPSSDPDNQSKILRFRFEILDDLGNSRTLILSDGKNLSWKDFSKEEIHLAELSEKNLRKFLPLANSIEETLGLLIGKIPKLEIHTSSVIQSPCNSPQPCASSLYRLTFPQGEMLWNDEKQVIEFLALKSKNGKLAFQFEGKNFIYPIVSPTKEMTIAIPSQIKLVDLKTKNEIEINYKVIDIGMRLSFSPSLFELEP